MKTELLEQILLEQIKEALEEIRDNARTSSNSPLLTREESLEIRLNYIAAIASDVLDRLSV